MTVSLGGPAARVLVVDDNAEVVDLLVMLLEMDGVPVQGTSRPADALALACACRPDVVLTDLHMPDISGAELSAQLRAALPGVQVWAATGLSPEAMATWLEAGVFERVFHKPMDVEHIVQALRQRAR